jgi:hypothetical protein
MRTESGATTNLEECKVADKSKENGLRVDGKGTCVKARKCTFQGKDFSGVFIESEATAQLDGCTVASNKYHNVLVRGKAAVGLVGCIIADSLIKTGFVVIGKGMFGEALDSTFQGKRFSVYVDQQGTVQLDKCTMMKSPQGNVGAAGSAFCTIVSCTLTDSSEWSEGTWGGHLRGGQELHVPGEL